MRETPVAYGSSGHVLLAEDHPVNQRVATAMLENLGYRVDLVADGAEAVKAAGRTRYRSILMDCQLPVLDGFEATAAIRAHEGSTRHTPIVAVTASGTGSDHQRCLDAGMDDYLIKPLSLRALANVLARWGPSDMPEAIVAEPAETPSVPGTAWPDQVDLGRPTLDPVVIERLERLGAAGGDDLLGRLTELFLSDADLQIVALREALDDDDVPALVRPAHMLSGASANLGARDLARMCATMATDAAAGDPTAGPALFHAIESELERVRASLRSRVPPT